jgi:hypothetical protein
VPSLLKSPVCTRMSPGGSGVPLGSSLVRKLCVSLMCTMRTLILSTESVVNRIVSGGIKAPLEEKKMTRLGEVDDVPRRIEAARQLATGG